MKDIKVTRSFPILSILGLIFITLKLAGIGVAAVGAGGGEGFAMSNGLFVFGLLVIGVCALVAAWLDVRRARSHEEFMRARRARLELKAQVERDARGRL